MGALLLIPLIHSIMQSSDLLIALCGTSEVEKSICTNTKDFPINKAIEEDFCVKTRIVCGHPKQDATYLVTNSELPCVVPDLLYDSCCKSDGEHTRHYAFLMSDVPLVK